MEPINDLPGLSTFERIVALGSLTAAAAELGLTLAVVSKRLAAFEQRLGVRLIHRSTRRLTVTEEGRLLYVHAVRVMTELSRAREALARQRQEITGLLKLTAPYSLGRRRLVPLLARFSERHPGVRIQLQLSDELLDLIAGGVDIAFRYGALQDSRLVARELVSNRRVLCASPEYLRRHGQPQRLAELQRHRCILTSPLTEWRFDCGRRVSPQAVAAHIVCNDGEASQAMALAGMGIVLKSIWDVADDLAGGRLVQILPRHAVSAAPLNVVHVAGHDQVPRVQIFLEFLTEQMASSKIFASEKLPA
jgi:DNA-binding transcriptional LysR family regulator